MTLCILCQLKLKTANCDSLLDKAICGICAANSPKMPKHTEADAMADGRNVCKAGTSTLRPKLHTIEPELIIARYDKIVKTTLRGFSTASYFHGTFELTAAGVVHAHFYVCTRRAILGKLLARLRRAFGFVKTANISDLSIWYEYMYKEQEDEDFPILKISS